MRLDMFRAATRAAEKQKEMSQEADFPIDSLSPLDSTNGRNHTVLNHAVFF
jgi:hypothetical protein